MWDGKRNMKSKRIQAFAMVLSVLLLCTVAQVLRGQEAVTFRTHNTPASFGRVNTLEKAERPPIYIVHYVHENSKKTLPFERVYIDAPALLAALYAAIVLIEYLISQTTKRDSDCAGLAIIWYIQETDGKKKAPCLFS